MIRFISSLLGRLLCRLGFHRAVTWDDGSALRTSDGYEVCERCGWIGWPTL